MRQLGLAMLILFVSCASEAPPPGGPEDKTPPSIVETEPKPDTVGVSTTTDIVIRFSEYLNRRSVAPSIFISPFISTDYEVDVSRSRVTIDFGEPLQDSTTYIITLGTGIADLRGNRLSQSYQLAFSTGSEIDRGVMRGRIYRPESGEGSVTVVAYRDEGLKLDSLLRRRPDYISNPGPNGVFQFSSIQPGQYFFLAVGDQNRNFLYDSGEQTGVPSDTFWTVTDSITTTALRMKMFQYPADSLVLTTVSQQNRHQLTAGFNRVPQQQPDEQDFMFISQQNDTLHPAAVSRGEQPSEYYVEQYQLPPDSTYLFLARDLTDEFGLPFGMQRDRRDIELSTTKDTLALEPPAISVQDSATGVSQSGEFTIQYNRAIQPLAPDSILHISNIDTGTYDIIRRDNRTLVALPDSLWPAGQWLRWTLVDSVVRDLRDSTYSDSLTSGSFQFEPGTRYGAVTGEVAASEAWIPGRIRVRAHLMDPEQEYQTRVNNQYRYEFRRLLPGTYWFEAYYDADSSATYSPGRPLPFVPSEKFVILQDSIEVRSRWETSAVNLKFLD